MLLLVQWSRYKLRYSGNSCLFQNDPLAAEGYEKNNHTVLTTVAAAMLPVAALTAQMRCKIVLALFRSLQSVSISLVRGKLSLLY